MTIFHIALTYPSDNSTNRNSTDCSVIVATTDGLSLFVTIIAFASNTSSRPIAAGQVAVVCAVYDIAVVGVDYAANATNESWCVIGIAVI